jgi:hypothetical protein
MKYFLTVIMCSLINGETVCTPPHTFNTQYNDVFDCMVDGYNKSSDKTIEIGRDVVNEYKVFIKFGCSEGNPKQTSS